jgi:hypothetical protein
MVPSMASSLLATAGGSRAGACRRPERLGRDEIGPPRAVAALLRRHRRQAPPVRGRRLRFAGVGDRDVYNPTRRFSIGGRRVLAARVESRASETDSQVVFFEERRGVWRPVPGAPVLALQDPFAGEVGGALVLGGVEIAAAPGQALQYRTVFYRGDALSRLLCVAAGPWGMKDVRLAALDDGRVLVLTRPQGARGGRGKIGWAVASSLDHLTPELMDDAPIIEGLFADGEWGGANEITPLGGDRFGVLGHIACFDHRGHRGYYPVAFEIDLERGRVTEPVILAERRDLPGGLRGASKRPDLRDVLFSGGLEPAAGGRATLYLGAGDAEVYQLDIADPFAAR